MLSKTHDILLVEDHADSAAALSRLLIGYGHRVRTVGTCKMARETFTAHPSIDVLLVDLGLPDCDGCDLLRDLRALRYVPAVAITGYDHPQDLERSSQAGFVAHITKPLDLQELKTALASIKLQPLQ
jgi:CheY-like chemotaxis protein